MFRRWMKYRYLRFLVNLKKNSIGVYQRLETQHISKLDQIQSLVYEICVKLIQDSNSELRTNKIDYTYHIENDNCLIIIRPQSGHYSITLIEYTDRQHTNNFDVPFDVDHVRILIETFEREIHKRMKSRQLLKTTKVAKHLQVILSGIEKKQKQN